MHWGSLTTWQMYLKLSGVNWAFCASGWRMMWGTFRPPMVYPSGRALAISVNPMMPPAPGLYTNTHGCGAYLFQYFCIIRACTSLEPPAVKAMIMLIGFSG